MRTLSCQCNSPSKRALHTSSFVAFSALSIIAMFCDFFGSRTLFSWLHKLEFGPLPPLLDDRLVEFETNNVSIISSFTLLSYKELNTLTNTEVSCHESNGVQAMPIPVCKDDRASPERARLQLVPHRRSAGARAHLVPVQRLQLRQSSRIRVSVFL